MNIDNNFFDSMVNRIYPSELQLNKANVSDTEASFLDLHLSISDGFVKTKIYDKRDDFDFDIVNFPFLDGDVPRSTSYGVYISQLIRFARVSSHVDDFNTRNKVLTAKLLSQGYRYQKIRKAFSKFYRRHFDIVSKYNVGLKSWLVGCFGFNDPLRQYFSLYRVVSQREGERRERIEESKKVQTTPTRTYCKRNRPLPYYHPNCRTPRHWKFTQDHRTTQPPPD